MSDTEIGFYKDLDLGTENLIVLYRTRFDVRHLPWEDLHHSKSSRETIEENAAESSAKQRSQLSTSCRSRSRCSAAQPSTDRHRLQRTSARGTITPASHAGQVTGTLPT